MGRGVLVVFCAVFAILFTAVGYWAGLRPLASTLQAALSVQSWQPVPAQVLDAQIRKHAGSEGGTTYQVLVRYRYEMAGKSYESQRVGLNPRRVPTTWVIGRSDGFRRCTRRSNKGAHHGLGQPAQPSQGPW